MCTCTIEEIAYDIIGIAIDILCMCGDLDMWYMV